MQKETKHLVWFIVAAVFLVMTVLIIFGCNSAQAQDAPTGYTPNYGLRLWDEGDYPSADSVNQNLIDIDLSLKARHNTLDSLVTKFNIVHTSAGTLKPGIVLPASTVDAFFYSYFYKYTDPSEDVYWRLRTDLTQFDDDTLKIKSGVFATPGGSNTWTGTNTFNANVSLNGSSNSIQNADFVSKLTISNEGTSSSVTLKDTLSGSLLITDHTANKTDLILDDITSDQINTGGLTANEFLMVGESAICVMNGNWEFNNAVIFNDGVSVALDLAVSGSTTIGGNATVTGAVTSASIETTGAGKFQMIQGKQGTLSSATNMSTPSANLIFISGTTTIATMGTTGLRAGTRVTLRFGSGVTVNHSGASNGFRLAGSSNTAFSAGDCVEFMLMDISGVLCWKQIAPKVSE